MHIHDLKCPWCGTPIQSDYYRANGYYGERADKFRCSACLKLVHVTVTKEYSIERGESIKEFPLVDKASASSEKIPTRRVRNG
jgi:hypothetical protein